MREEEHPTLVWDMGDDILAALGVGGSPAFSLEPSDEAAARRGAPISISGVSGGFATPPDATAYAVTQPTRAEAPKTGERLAMVAPMNPTPIMAATQVHAATQGGQEVEANLPYDQEFPPLVIMTMMELPWLPCRGQPPGLPKPLPARRLLFHRI